MSITMGNWQPFHDFAIMTPHGPSWTGKVELIPEMLEIPPHWRKPRKIFVNSMSDLFHENLPFADVLRVFETMWEANWHTYQILTKRPERMLDFWRYLADLNSDVIQEHIWLGVSVEDRKNKDRIDILRKTPAAVRFLSLEPLLEDLGTLDLRGISWVIVGGESGHGARPMDVQWARDIRDQCQAAGVPCFIKQLGAKPITEPRYRHSISLNLHFCSFGWTVERPQRCGGLSPPGRDLRGSRHPR